MLQGKLGARAFRLYANRDIVGVEAGGALKNVVALATGLSDGLGLGENARAALVTRGLAEMTRLAVALGGESTTLAGLAGMGDLVLTATGTLSRNRALGMALARGDNLTAASAKTRMVAEGVPTVRSALALARRHDVSLPVCAEVAAGLYDRMNGVGAHEVVIETPDHSATLATMPSDAVADVFLTFRDRILDLKKDPRFEYVLVFKNHGEAAGASLEHPHSQLIATPIIPIMVTEELAGSQQYWQRKERCVWCDVIRQDRRDRRRVVAESAGFIVLEPFAPRFPFETWILPVRHRSAFEESGVEELRGLAEMVGTFLRRMNRTLGSPPLNFMLHTAPCRERAGEHVQWHREILPKLTRVAGYEWGSGFFINPAPPEDAADALRAAAP